MNTRTIVVSYLLRVHHCNSYRHSDRSLGLSPGLRTVFEGYDRIFHPFAGPAFIDAGFDDVEIFSGVPRVMPPISEIAVNLFGGRITVQRLAISIIALFISAAVILVIKTTRFGKALRAASEDYEAAMLQGINYRQIARNGFLFGALLAAIAGCLIAPLGFITPFAGSDYLIRAFIIVIIGGLGSIPGTVIAGFLVAGIESIVSYVYDPTVSTIALFVVVICTLIVRPQGIMGHVER